MKGPLIEVRQVSFYYGERKIVDDASLSIDQNSIVAIMGPSGCGKSTLLRIISGLEKPATGICRFDEKEVKKSPKDLRYSFQDYDAFPWRTVEQNLCLFSRACGNDDKTDELIKQIGLLGHGKKFPPQLSGGMRKRLALGRCIAGAPKGVLLDEPFSSLDLSSREDLHKLVLDLARQMDCTFVIVTHDINEAIFLSSRIFISTPLPFHVRKIIDVPFQYPRSPDIQRSREFENLYTEVRSLLVDPR